jgi:hypothetical protein
VEDAGEGANTNTQPDDSQPDNSQPEYPVLDPNITYRRGDRDTATLETEGPTDPGRNGTQTAKAGYSYAMAKQSQQFQEVTNKKVDNLTSMMQQLLDRNEDQYIQSQEQAHLTPESAQ